MTTHRRYHFIHPGAWTAGGYDKALIYLESMCESHWWYNEPVVKGEPLGKMILEFTVSGHDQWRCHQRAILLAEECYEYLGLTVQDVPEPLWEPLEPHRNRGRYRVPKAPSGQD